MKVSKRKRGPAKLPFKQGDRKAVIIGDARWIKNNIGSVYPELGVTFLTGFSDIHKQIYWIEAPYRQVEEGELVVIETTGRGWSDKSGVFWKLVEATD